MSRYGNIHLKPTQLFSLPSDDPQQNCLKQSPTGVTAHVYLLYMMSLVCSDEIIVCMAFDFMFIHRLLVKAIEEKESRCLKLPQEFKTLSEPTDRAGSRCFPFVTADSTDKQPHTALKSYNHLMHKQESLSKNSLCLCLNLNQDAKYTQRFTLKKNKV